MKRFIASITTLALSMALFTGCSGKEQTGSDVSADQSGTSNAAPPFTLTAGVVPTFDDVTIPTGKKISIGYLAQNETDQFNVYLGEVIQDEASRYGDQIDFFMSDAQSQASIQVSQAEDMVIKKPDVVIINAVDQEASAPAVSALSDAEIPVILLNTSVSNLELATSYVGIDDKEVGMMLAQMIGEALNGKGTVNVIQGLLGHPANERRWIGVQEVLEKDYPNIKIGATQAADWDRNKAMNVAEDWISSGDNFDAVISLNDEMAISAQKAFEAAGKNDVLVVGADAIEEMLELIKDGKMYGTVFQNGDAEGRCALNVAVAAALGVTVDKEYMIPNEIVTQSNVEEYFGRNVLE